MNVSMVVVSFMGLVPNGGRKLSVGQVRSRSGLEFPRQVGLGRFPVGPGNGPVAPAIAIGSIGFVGRSQFAG